MTGYTSLPYHMDELMTRLEKRKQLGADVPSICRSFYDGDDIGKLIFKCVSQLIQDYNEGKVRIPKVAFLLNQVMNFLDASEVKGWQLPKSMQAEKIRAKIAEL